MRQKSTSPLNLSFLKFLNDQSKLNLGPDYQREAVWTRSQKQLLIDSLLNDMDVPKLYFHQRLQTPPDYDVVDGQQRLRSVFEYLTDQYPLSRDADPVNGLSCADLLFSELPTQLQQKLLNAALDVVILTQGYSEDDVREMFGRLQNGTSLNAAEKRHAMPGGMNLVVRELAQHPSFRLAAFTNRRFAFEDTVAKVLHIMLSGNGDITDIKPASVKRTYERHDDLTMNDPVVKRLKGALSALNKIFADGPSPELKKYAIISLVLLLADLQATYDIAPHVDGLGHAYRSFEHDRQSNAEREEQDQDVELNSYGNAARSDSIPDMRFRRDTLRRYLLLGTPELEPKDPLRDFTQEQRLAVHWRDKGVCQLCRAECADEAYEIDHIVPHARGGKTTLSNAQLLCPPCNRRKSDSMPAS